MRTKSDNPVFIALLGLVGFLLPAFEGDKHRAGPGRSAPADSGASGADSRASGSGADKPSDIPPRGWWDVLKRTGQKVSENALMTQAAAITFYALLSIFPALAALVSLYGLIADPKTISDQMAGLAGILPGGGVDIINDQLKSLSANGGKGLGFGALIGLATSLWSANQGMKALFSALNVVNGEKERRSFIRFTAVTLAFTVGMIVFMVIALAGIVAVPAALNSFGMGGVTKVLLNWLRWPILLVVVALMLALVYRYGPSRERARWRWITWGSGFAAVTWVVVSLLFSWYVANFGSYNKTYGSLGAVIGFMTWIWLSTTIVLIGDQLNAELEVQTDKDTTTGPAQPRGTRGAAPADSVAASRG